MPAPFARPDSGPRRSVLMAAAFVMIAAATLVQAPGHAAVCSEPAPGTSSSPSPSASPSLPVPTPSESQTASPDPSPSISLPGIPGTAQRANNGDEAGDPPPAEACKATVTLQALPAGGVVGTTVVLSGTLACNGNVLNDKSVTLKKLSGGTWVAVGDGTTGGDEAGFGFTQKPSVTTAYKVAFAGDALCEAAESPVMQIVMRPGVAMNAAASQSRGGTAVFSGMVAPSHAGHSVILQVLQGGAWRNATSARLDSGSRYRLTYTRKSGSGPLLFRIAYPTQHADHGWNVGRSIRVTWS